MKLRAARHAFAQVALLGALLTPTSGFAQASGPSEPAPSLFSYGFRGLFNGAALGLATGHLATGGGYDDGEWKTLVLGAGVGAIAGVGTGVALALVDRSTGGSTGWLVLRDLWYGALLGGLTGAAVGALVYIDSEHPRDILTGAALGGLIGAGLGAGFGVLEGATAPPRKVPAGSGLRPTVLAASARNGLMLAAGLAGRF